MSYKRKIGIVNRTNLKNYGSVLQCYALCKVVNNLGYESEIVWERGNISKNFDFRPSKIIKTAIKIATHPSLIESTVSNIKEIRRKSISLETIELFEQFVEKHIRQKLMAHKNLVRCANSSEYFKFICGSDQVWCSTTAYVDPLMYLRFAPEQKRIAYAPSIGRDYIPEYNRREMQRYIMGIPSVSVREESGKKLIRELTGREVPVVLDPTLLVDRKDWILLENKPITKSVPYILCYFLDTPSGEVQKNIGQCAKKNRLSIVSIGRELTQISDDVKNENIPCGPSEFISYIGRADVVITDSYHGMLFSVIFEKKFWSVQRDYQQFDQSSRQLTILRKLKLENRYLRNGSDFTMEDIDYVTINPILEELKQKSKAYLQAAIEK